MKKNPLLTIPRHLSVHMRSWVASILDRYEIEEQNFSVLICAAEAWDRLQQARKVIQKRGLTYSDRWGAPRMRPECAVERDSRIAHVRCLRELALESEAVADEPPARSAPSIPRKR